MRAEPRSQVRGLGLDHAVSLPGPVDAAFGLVAPEAMMCGKPVVHFDLPTLRWLSGDARVPPYDVPCLARQMRELAADEPARRALGLAAHAAATGFTLEKAAGRYRALVRELAPVTPAAAGPPGPLSAAVGSGTPRVVLSPHLDDAALSCGALMIHARGLAPG